MTSSGWRCVFRLGPRALVVGLVAAVVLARPASVAGALAAAWRVPWVVGLVLPLFLLWNHAGVLGWRTLWTAVHGASKPSLWRLTAARMGAAAVNMVLPTGGVGGEVIRVAASGASRETLAGSAVVVVLDDAASTLAVLLLVAVSGAVLAFMSADGPAWTAVASALLLLVGILLWGAPAVLARVARWKWIERRVPRLTDVLRDAGRRRALIGRALRRSTGWHVVERVLTCVEIWVAAVALGLAFGPLDALVAGGLMTGASLLFFFVPGQLGAAEGAMAAAFAVLGFPPETGLAVALLRRGRQVVTSVLGLVLLAAVPRWRSGRAVASEAG